MNLAISGLASGFDWQSLVNQLADVDRAPQQTMLAEQTKLEQRSQAFGALKTSLEQLRARIKALNEESLFDGRTGTSSDTELGTVSVAAGASVGKYNFKVTQLATASRQTGTAGAGSALATSDDVSGVSLSSAGFASAVTAGVFTVNGKQITVADTDTLGAVLARISDATGGDVTAGYSSGTDKITLSSASPIILGSATDTSNFLQVTKLYSNGAGTVTSRNELGAVRLGATLDQANLATAITGGASGEFKINGVSIQYDSTTDTVADVLDRINGSSAGVTASYDSVADRFTLLNKSTGSNGIALEDVSGSNFLAATGLLGGSLSLGKNLEYTINDGGTLTSQSNTITEASSGIAGLSVTALAEDSFSVTVGNDTAAIKTAITSFIDSYNSLQSQIGTYTASSTDAKGKVTAGLLADDPEAAALASQLRSLATSTLTGLDGSVFRLESLGISSNGYDDSLSTAGISALDTALSDNLASVKSFFTQTDLGWAGNFDDFLEATIGDDGTLVAHQSTLSKQAAAITTQISDQEKWVQGEIERLTAGFVAMETAQSKANQQLEYLTRTFS